MVEDREFDDDAKTTVGAQQRAITSLHRILIGMALKLGLKPEQLLASDDRGPRNTTVTAKIVKSVEAAGLSISHSTVLAHLRRASTLYMEERRKTEG